MPGRLCILGEHSDWAAEYRDRNSSLPLGHTLVCATNEGLYARVHSIDKPNTVRFYSHAHEITTDSDENNTPGVLERVCLGITPPNPISSIAASIAEDVAVALSHEQSGANCPSARSVEMPMRKDVLLELAKSGGFYSYIAGTVLVILESEAFINRFPEFDVNSGGNQNINGILIDNYSTTLPMQKGLSSSAAVCVMVATAFNKFYQLSWNTADLMEVAYKGEMMTPSRCGRMDQCVVMGPNAMALMTFDSQRCSLKTLHCGCAFYFVVVNLNAFKDTVVILRELNDCFPLAQNDTQALMHRYIDEIASIADKVEDVVARGDVNSLAELMRTAQHSFDRCAMPNCPSQLTSPVLHSLMNDPVLRGAQNDSDIQSILGKYKVKPPLALAVKGIGSQGDGSAQILCSSLEGQQAVLEYFRHRYNHMEAFPLTISKN